jgi:tetratricopeptide (TPR) repeat protein/tRNA A-37 threonylcarbamoyl transferase component Bud32
MPETTSQETLDTNASEVRLNRFEAAWRTWRSGEPTPRWQEHLPADDEPCHPILIFDLLQLDIEYRIKAGLPALLAEPYFAHPCLQREDARLDADKQVELIRWEYGLRRQIGQTVRPAEYQAAFPQHADALRDLKVTSKCPRCQQIIVQPEDHETLHCPACDGTLLASDAVSPTELDLRGYELSEQLGKGGMGEVYRSCDPALGRDLAIKVVKERYRGDQEIERRFVREARITGSLQHPGIVPIHNLGRLNDGRLHYTMRLVRGQSFADILKDEGGKPERLPYLLTTFEKICQAVAYAHSKHVLHRDLKPHNVMVGRFGEVQVLDWGLAKLLTPDGASVTAPETTDEADTRIYTESLDAPSDQTRAGSALGTAAYMPPEQALGEWDTVDERADVFALGSILCEILTGKPAYSGRDVEEALRRARRGDVSEAQQRLEQCQAEAVLISLCRECLSPQREGRPRDAGVLAERLKNYQAEVQERLRQAELERVEAQTRAREEQARALVEKERTREALARVAAERRAQRRTRALAAAVLLFVLGGTGGLWWQQRQQTQRRDRMERNVSQAVGEAKALAEQARRLSGTPDQLENMLGQAKSAAERAWKLLETDNAGDLASPALRDQVQELNAELTEKLEQARQAVNQAAKDRRMQQNLESIRLEQTAARAGEFDKQAALPLYASAFREYGIDIESLPEAEAGAAISGCAIKEELLAALDEWALRRPDRAGKERLTRIAQAVERNPNGFGHKLREARSKGEASNLKRLAKEVDVRKTPPTTLVHLAEALSQHGDWAGAVELLKMARVHYPGDFWINHDLGMYLSNAGSPKLEEVIGCFRAALAARPSSPGMYLRLGSTLRIRGQLEEAVALYHKAIELDPDYAPCYNNMGNVLQEQGKLDEALIYLRKAIALNPKEVKTYNILGHVLYRKSDHEGAIASWRKSLELNPKDSDIHNRLAVSLLAQGKQDEAVAEFRKSLELDPKNAQAHNNLGISLRDQGKLDEAIAEYQKAILLDPKFAAPHSNLGGVLAAQGKWKESIAEHQKALELDPKSPQAHNNLGLSFLAMGQLDEAIQEFRKAIALDPKLARARDNLGKAEQMLAVRKKINSILAGEEKPAGTEEILVMAQLCQQSSENRHAASARLYQMAFAADPKAAADLDNQYRYDAACNAARAAAGQSEDARLLPDKTVAMFRGWALGWLRDDLSAYAKLAAQNNSAANQEIQKRLTHWRSDADLASVRDPSALNRLPDNERAAWQVLWRDVDKLAKRAKP